MQRPLICSMARILFDNLSPKASYSLGDIILLLKILLEKGPIGRRTLIKELQLGERSTRNLLKKLEELGFIERDPVAGAFIQPSLRRRLQDDAFKINFKKTDNEYCMIIMDANGKPPRLSEILQLRDCIIRGWCTNPLIAIMRKGGYRIEIPGLEYTSEHYPIYKGKILKCVENENIIRETVITHQILIALYSAESYPIAKNCLGLSIYCYCTLFY